MTYHKFVDITNLLKRINDLPSYVWPNSKEVHGCGFFEKNNESAIYERILNYDLNDNILKKTPLYVYLNQYPSDLVVITIRINPYSDGKKQNFIYFKPVATLYEKVKEKQDFYVSDRCPSLMIVRLNRNLA